MKARVATCGTCGDTFEVRAPGPLPRTCPKHRPSVNRARQAKAAEARGDLEAAAELARSSPADWSTMPEVAMAVGLALYPDRKRAAQVVGLEGTAKQLEAWEKAARRDYSDVVENSAGGMKRLAFTFIQLQLAGLIRDSDQIPANQRAGAVKSVVGAMEAIQNSGAKVIPTKTTVVWSRE